MALTLGLQAAPAPAESGAGASCSLATEPAPNEVSTPADAFHWSRHSIAFLVGMVLCIARRPGALFHAAFYAEDGHVWYADAYNAGWLHALGIAHTGYFQTFPRLGAAIALLFPLTQAPWIMNMLAMAVMALPVPLLLSDRMRHWGTLRFRIALAALYLLLPNAYEIGCGITESQWLLALSAFLVLAAEPPTNGWKRALELFLLALCGSTGPFCLLLAAIGAVLAYARGGLWRWIRSLLLAAFNLLQLWALLIIDAGGRERAPVGASADLFFRLLGGQVYLGTILGGSHLATLPGLGWSLFYIVLTIGGTGLLVIHFVRTGLEMRLFLLFCGSLFVLALVSPTGWVPKDESFWRIWASSPGVRYWFLPTLAFAWTLAWIAFRTQGKLRTLGRVLLLLMAVGVVRDWKRPAFSDSSFAAEAQRFRSLPPGSSVVFPLQPAGWQMRLIKD